MHHKIRLRDDPRIDSVIFFEDQLILVGHLKQSNQEGKRIDHGARVEAFKQITKFEQLNEFAAEELLIFKIFDKIRVKVDTTIEFPLDIKCSLVIGQADIEEFNRLALEQEVIHNMAEGASQEAARLQGGVVEIENLDADV